MNRQGKLRELATKSMELIWKVIKCEGNDTVITNISCNESYDTIIFELKVRKSIEYNLSEICWIFEDDIDGLEIFNKKKYKDIFQQLKSIQLQTVQI